MDSDSSSTINYRTLLPPGFSVYIQEIDYINGILTEIDSAV